MHKTSVKSCERRVDGYTLLHWLRFKYYDTCMFEDVHRTWKQAMICEPNPRKHGKCLLLFFAYLHYLAGPNSISHIYLTPNTLDRGTAAHVLRGACAGNSFLYAGCSADCLFKASDIYTRQRRLHLASCPMRQGCARNAVQNITSDRCC